MSQPYKGKKKGARLEIYGAAIISYLTLSVISFIVEH